MHIGLPKEIKDQESRVGLTPAGVRTLCDRGHSVLVEKGAGLESGITDDAFRNAKGQIIDSIDEIWERADMIVKVKEPVGPEYDRMREGQILFTYLHLAPLPELTDAMIKKNTFGDPAMVRKVIHQFAGLYSISISKDDIDSLIAATRIEAEAKKVGGAEKFFTQQFLLKALGQSR